MVIKNEKIVYMERSLGYYYYCSLVSTYDYTVFKSLIPNTVMFTSITTAITRLKYMITLFNDDMITITNISLPRSII